MCMPEFKPVTGASAAMPRPPHGPRPSRSVIRNAEETSLKSVVEN